jgi:membrane peptidoglycan carboxypeptidase
MPRRRPHLTFGTVLSHLGVIVAISAVVGVLAAGLVIPVVGAVGYGASATARSMKNLPEELKATPLAQRTRVLDRNGNLIATFYDQNRVNVPLSKVAPIMKRAIIAIEDYRFYEHGALDLKGTLRAFVNNQTSSGTQGGSSITQQMAKMTLLAQARTEAERKAATANTYQRKIQELRHAIAFEQNYSKDWILERYLNLAYFGDGAYGIQAAARHYFSVNASQLDTAQSATLAGLVKNPVGFDPTRFKDRAVARRNVVLDRMAELNVIPQETADKLVKEGLGLKVSKRRNGCLGTSAAFFCDYVRRYLLADPALGRTVADRAELINSGGLTIKTTVDLRFQRAADAAAKASVKPKDQAIGALAMVQPGTGAVRAIAQSRPMGRDRKKGETFLNYIVNSKYGDSNGFQAGSTFKLFVMAAALEQGLPASTSFNSPAQVHIPQNEFADCNGQYPSTQLWEPHNSTKNGFFNMYQGAQLSVNTYFAQLEKKTGLCKPFALARSMGVELDHPRSERVPSFTLGVADVSPLEMAGAYATVAARGEYCATQPVTKILNSSGQVFKDYKPQCQQVMKQDTADTINDILHGVMEPGGFGQLLNIDKESAGKTGTIQNNKAVWFDGYTPELATAAMIAGANSTGTPITLNGQSVGGRYIDVAHGSTVAGPMWALAMRRIQDLIPATSFHPPIAPEPRPYVPPAPNTKKPGHGGGNGGGHGGGHGGGKPPKP